MSKTNTIATEAGHWYAQDGTPRYTIVGKNGKERATTIRDARKEGYVPSVTTILQVLAKPGLTKWMQTQVLHASLTLPRRDGESEDAFAERVIADSEEQSRKAREAGTAVHTAIERSIRGEDFGYQNHVDRVWISCRDRGIDLDRGDAEKSFAHPLGFGGKVDWHNDSTVVDFKTKDRIEDGKRLAWDEHAMQLAAYALGLGITAPRCLNVFVGVSDGRVSIHEWSAAEIRHGEQMFRLCLELWKLKNNWMPDESVEDSITRQTGGQL